MFGGLDRPNLELEALDSAIVPFYEIISNFLVSSNLYSVILILQFYKNLTVGLKDIVWKTAEEAEEGKGG